MPILLLLMMVSLLVAAWAQRSALNEIRSSALQQRHGIAFEAAEAGLALTQALLNSGRPIGDDCRTSTDPAGQSFGARFLRHDTDAAGHVDVALRARGVSAGAPVLACTRQQGSWSCACPAEQVPVPPGAGDAGDGAEPAPTFSVRLHDGSHPAAIVASIMGCSDFAAPCIAGAPARADATTGLRQTLALLPMVATPPAAALTVRENVSAPAPATLGVHNRDAASGGVAVHAGGRIDAPALRSTGASGAAVQGERIGGDATLAALSREQLFQRHFGLPLDRWKQQPGVHRLSCGTAAACDTALLARTQTEADVARLAIEGDLHLAGPLEIGSASRPVVLIVDGDLRLEGAIRIHGVVHAHHLHWAAALDDASATITGAVILSGSFSTDGSPRLSYDAGLIRRLQTRAGTWVRVPGSWRDEG